MSNEFLNEDGKVPEVRERLVIPVMIGINTLAHFEWRRRCGIQVTFFVWKGEYKRLDASSVVGVKRIIARGCGRDG